MFLCLSALPASAFEFDALEGGTLDLTDLRGQAVLVVNTASLCGFTDQYAGLQTLHERYGDRGFTVVGVPSDDFRQELSDDAAVAEFCEVNYGLTFPMTAITPVTGDDAHPFYAWLADQGERPRWNFNKALLDPEGQLVTFEGSSTRPLSRKMISAIEGVLPE
ncbi:glutathione peroxidase [Jannaschia pagri]|uniref:Glutathione peroxidase n=2 Tax=Jannaschia TaxID=188905 RepID=A0ABQ4NP48_9RHOB|nr:glutathione peroxidase [Jannaschia sp. AI_62]GIT92318.1 glutathione peroxidase [Jannaschia sp. AI_61]GIT96153.1 glutathione peroxidase [Jannaschia sp. AI_62]